MRFVRANGNNELCILDNQIDLLKEGKDFFTRRDHTWVGEEIRNYGELLKRFDRDWAGALYDLDTCRKKIKDVELPQLRSKMRKRKFNKEEGDLDIERYIEGSDRLYETQEREVREGNSEVTIIIDTVAGFCEDSKDIFWRGAAGLVIAEKCEEAGYKSEIWASATVEGMYESQNGTLMVASQLKRCQDPFDVSSMVNSLGGWFFRTAMIAMFDRVAKEKNSKATVGHGYVSYATPDMLAKITNDLDCYYICGVHSLSGAIAIVCSTLEKLKKVQNNFGQH